MSTIGKILSGFALYTDLDGEVVDALCENYGTASVERLQEAGRLGDPILYDEAADIFRTGGSACWMPEIGRLNELVSFGGEFLGAANAQMLAAMIVRGWNGNRQISIPHLTKILCGHVSINVKGLVDFSANENIVSIEAGDFSVKMNRSVNFLSHESAVQALYSAADGSVVTLLGGYNVDSDMLVLDDWPLDRAAVDGAFDSVFEGLQLLESTSDRAHQWVTRIIRQIAVVAPKDGGRHVSRSIEHRPGCVVLSAPASPALLAEGLVHEASHQYYYLCLRLGSFARSRADEEVLFFSAINNRNRPITKLLLALHAVVNICLLLRDLERSSHGLAGYARNRLEHYAPINLSIASTIRAELERLSPNARDFAARVADVAMTFARVPSL